MTTSSVSAKCRDCGGERVDVRVAGGIGELFVYSYDSHDRPKGLKGAIGLTGVGCTSCGHVELYASEPERLRPT